MQSEDMILASEFCIHHNIELSLIYSLHESGLVEIIKIEENTFVPVSELTHLEKLVRLHDEMDINLEGIETITHLLKRINEMQQHIILLTNRLKAYD
jgi:chaperone modulatory protein CbpM